MGEFIKELTKELIGFALRMILVLIYSKCIFLVLGIEFSFRIAFATGLLLEMIRDFRIGGPWDREK